MNFNEYVVQKARESAFVRAITVLQDEIKRCDVDLELCLDCQATERNITTIRQLMEDD